MRASAQTMRTLANPSSLFQSQHFYNNKSIAALSNKPAVPISLKQMISFGKDINQERLLQSGNFVRQELPVRIAHRVRDLQNLPFVVGLNPSLERVYTGYLEAFERIRKFPPIRTLEENDRFCDFLRDQLQVHWITIPRMMIGLLESAPNLPAAPREKFMTRMLRSRISRRVLAEQHLALTQQYHDHHDHGPVEDSHRYIGIIDTQLSPYEAIKALEQIIPLVTGVKAEIRIDGDTDVTFSFIADHLRFIVFELLKNSVLAAARAHQEPKVLVTIANSPKLIGIRVSDESGGIPPDATGTTDPDGRSLIYSSRSSLLSFSHPHGANALSVLRDLQRLGATIDEQVGPEADKRLGLPGQRKNLAMGLGLCKVYAEYFGGHLQIYSSFGGGTDAYLSIPKLGIQTSAT